MPLENEIVPVRAGDLRGLLGMLHPERDWEVVPPDIEELLGRVYGQLDAEHESGAGPADDVPAPWPLPEGGQWVQMSFMGFADVTGYVTDITMGTEHVFHFDLPERVWGGNPLAWEEWNARSFRDRRPVTEESVRAAWEARRRAAAQRAADEAEWRRMQEQRALEAGTGAPDDVWDGDPDPEAAF